MEGQVESIALWDTFSPAVFCSKFEFSLCIKHMNICNIKLNTTVNYSNIRLRFSKGLCAILSKNIFAGAAILWRRGIITQAQHLMD